MRIIIDKLWLLVAIIILPLIVIAMLIVYCLKSGADDDVDAEKLGLSESERAVVPDSVMGDARILAGDLAGANQKKYRRLLNWLLMTYIKVKDKDVVIIFNSGGWGWKLIEETPGWISISEGMESILDDLGYASVTVDYRRTNGGMRECLREYWEGATRYPLKRNELARSVEFLTDNLPDLRVIITGESNGTVIIDSTMCILRDNQRVYSIRTGTPSWHEPLAQYRTLLLNTNGLSPDTFSQGNLPVMLWVTIKDHIGLSRPEDPPGTALSFLRSPGHHYSWQYPYIYHTVLNFLEENFKAKRV